MRGFLFLKMQMPGKKRSKIEHLARLFNAADAFSGAKYTRKSNCRDTLGCADIPGNKAVRTMMMPPNSHSGLAPTLSMQLSMQLKPLQTTAFRRPQPIRFDRPSESIHTCPFDCLPVFL
ncbi:hypothetical protein LVJ83_08625 [Uruburuella testudinis]|uniref:Uncharacterized protein n=1 Tax=Uruburuella testudinis TaxID=1282863 RepID=A0ABY4DRL7_9NEIS|nr:hypothetical protein [Uruburuella testudinis]UOO81043.1 hypothetical protein LVJ83_08625 [Uruburuella testudinis]